MYGPPAVLQESAHEVNYQLVTFQRPYKRIMQYIKTKIKPTNDFLALIQILVKQYEKKSFHK
jgi:hypothetical protein